MLISVPRVFVWLFLSFNVDSGDSVQALLPSIHNPVRESRAGQLRFLHNEDYVV